MRSRIILALLTIAAFSVPGTAQTPQQAARLQLVSTPWPPFTNPPGQSRFALDLVEAALGRIGVTSNTNIVAPADFTTSMLSGKFDGSAAAWKDPDRERVMVYSQPYLENRLVLVGRRGADVTATSLGALKGKKIALVEGYSYGEAVETSGPTFVRSKTEEDSLSMLLKSAVDYTLMDELVVQYILTNHEKEAQSRLQLGTTPLVSRALHLAVRRSIPDAQSIIDRFNAQLRAMVADRTYHRLLHVNWINADVDGDGVPELVPSSDQAGPTAPQRAYTVVSTEKPEKASTGSQRFYMGKTIYNSWSEVPDSYKVSAPGAKDPSQSTITSFRFSWK